MTTTALTKTPSRFGCLGLVAVCLISLSACSDMTVTQQRVLSGGAIGTAAGAVGTALTGGCIACGAAIGGAVGAGAGYAYDYFDRKGY